MQSEDAAREHERGVLVLLAVLGVTAVLALVIAGLLLVGCAMGAAG